MHGFLGLPLLLLPLDFLYIFCPIVTLRHFFQHVQNHVRLDLMYEGHPESKERLRIQSAQLFCCSRSLVSGVHYDVENFPHAVVCRILSRGKCRDSCGHGCADWESRRLWGARCYSFSAGRWNLMLSCRRGKLSRAMVLLHDNARPHTARQMQAFLREQFHWDIFVHPPYSPDLIPSDFFLFPKMEYLARKRFANDEACGMLS